MGECPVQGPWELQARGPEQAACPRPRSPLLGPGAAWVAPMPGAHCPQPKLCRVRCERTEGRFNWEWGGGAAPLAPVHGDDSETSASQSLQRAEPHPGLCARRPPAHLCPQAPGTRDGASGLGAGRRVELGLPLLAPVCNDHGGRGQPLAAHTATPPPGCTAGLGLHGPWRPRWAEATPTGTPGEQGRAGTARPWTTAAGPTASAGRSVVWRRHHARPCTRRAAQHPLAGSSSAHGPDGEIEAQGTESPTALSGALPSEACWSGVLGTEVPGGRLSQVDPPWCGGMLPSHPRGLLRRAPGQGCHAGQARKRHQLQAPSYTSLGLARGGIPSPDHPRVSRRPPQVSAPLGASPGTSAAPTSSPVWSSDSPHAQCQSRPNPLSPAPSPSPLDTLVLLPRPRAWLPTPWLQTPSLATQLPPPPRCQGAVRSHGPTSQAGRGLLVAVVGDPWLWRRAGGLRRATC